MTKQLIGVDVGGSHITCACVSGETFELMRESMVRRHVDTNASVDDVMAVFVDCLLYTSPNPRDGLLSRMPSSA